MSCEVWKTKLDAYLDGELTAEEMKAFDIHVHSCPSCAPDALGRVQMKRSIQSAGKRFTPTPDFRKRMQQSFTAKPEPRHFGLGWMTALAVIAILAIVGFAISYQGRQRSRAAEQAYGEVADIHVATLASASPFDVVSSDRHTVKPWFQGKIPFSFALPELQNSEFALLGGRLTYMEQTPGAHLIYEVRKHRISVLIFPEASLHGKLSASSPVERELSFNVETWSQDGLRYFVIGDAAAVEIDNLSKLLKSSN
jgi:anti-sigma factor RsiW